MRNWSIKSLPLHNTKFALILQADICAMHIALWFKCLTVIDTHATHIKGKHALNSLVDLMSTIAHCRNPSWHPKAVKRVRPCILKLKVVTLQSMLRQSTHVRYVRVAPIRLPWWLNLYLCISLLFSVKLHRNKRRLVSPTATPFLGIFKRTYATFHCWEIPP